MPTCGKQATDDWANSFLDEILPVEYHHIIFTVPSELRPIIAFNTKVCFSILFKAANLAMQQWACDTLKIKMGIIEAIHTFGSDFKFHPHIHSVITAGGLSLDGEKWIKTDPDFFRNISGLKKQWRYWVVKLLKSAHRKRKLRFQKSLSDIKSYPAFAHLLNKLYKFSWWVYIGKSLKDPRYALDYVVRYTKRAAMAEYRIVNYDGENITFSFKDYANGGNKTTTTFTVNTFIAMIIRHIPDKSFQIIRHYGLFANRSKKKYLKQARIALGIQTKNIQQELFSVDETYRLEKGKLSWAGRQLSYKGVDPLLCPKCNKPMTLIDIVFGRWHNIEAIFKKAGQPLTKGYLKLKPRSP